MTVLTKLGKLPFEFKVFLSLGQKLVLTLSKLFHFFKEALLCKKKQTKKKGGIGANVKLTQKRFTFLLTTNINILSNIVYVDASS